MRDSAWRAARAESRIERLEQSLLDEHSYQVFIDNALEGFFRTTREAYILSIFGVTFAPLLEELFFRGFLYPVLARRLGMAVAVFLTALGFAAVHGAQLMYSWGPVLVIFMVGLALTMVRARTRSVAASLLIHVAYNGTISILMYIATDRFRHLEKLNQ